MALTNCRECGKEISTLAAACPHCGAPGALQYDAEGVAVGSSHPPVAVVRAGGRYEGLGFVMIVLGMVVAMATDGVADFLGKAVGGAGLVVFLIGRFK